MSQLILFNKPYGVICQFSAASGQVSLQHYIAMPNFYPAGRLGRLTVKVWLLLTDDGSLQNRISHPKYKLPKTYWAQVEGIPTPQAL